jgi:hypothetical protein
MNLASAGLTRSIRSFAIPFHLASRTLLSGSPLSSDPRDAMVWVKRDVIAVLEPGIWQEAGPLHRDA